MLKSRGQLLGELVSTTRNTYANPGSVAQFDFHQSDKAKVSFPLLSFLSSNDLMEPARAWYWNCFANFSCSAVSVILAFLAGASVPADEASVMAVSHVRVSKQSCKQGNRLILRGV